MKDLPQNPERARQEMEELYEEIERLNRAYYDLDQPLASDTFYDRLSQRLRQLEEAFPAFIRGDSPTLRVGGEVDRRFQRVEHRVPMLSLNDVFSLDEVMAFVAQVQAFDRKTNFVVEEKIDGLSLALRYENGKLTTALTRGDGRHYGEDVTANARELLGLPKILPDRLPYLEVRGEVYFALDRFKALNEQRELMGEEPFANPRNAAAGTLRQLDPNLVKARGLSLYIFNLQAIEGKNVKSHAESLEYLKEQGFPISPHYFVVKTADEVYQAIEAIQRRKDQLNHAIDGAVVKVDDLGEREALGATAKAPRWAVAYKYPPEMKTTKLLEVRWQVGRSGRITPMAIFQPIQLAGTTVQRATLNNPDYIQSLDLHLDDTVHVIKSGEIIPQVLSVELKARVPLAKEVQPPKNCPVCGGDTLRIGADLYCSNPACIAKQQRKLEYFASKAAMDIEGLGPSTVERLIKDFHLTSVADFYRLKDKREELIESGDIGRTKRVDKLLAAIEGSKNQPLDRLLTALGIPGIGRENAKILVDAFPSIQLIQAAGIDDLEAIDGLGPVLAANVYEYFHNEENLKLLEELKGLDLKMEADTKQDPGDTPLNNLRFVITGSFPDQTRAELKELIEKNGGQVTGSVSAKTDYLLLGEKAGSKKAKADELGVLSINLDELLQMIGVDR